MSVEPEPDVVSPTREKYNYEAGQHAKRDTPWKKHFKVVYTLPKKDAQGEEVSPSSWRMQCLHCTKSSRSKNLNQFGADHIKRCKVDPCPAVR